MSKTTILIVEDEAIVAADLAGKLERLGYGIHGPTGFAEEAVGLARERRPDLVLMDIRLAGAMDGIEAAGIIRRELGLPVIYLTAHSDLATLERAKLTEPFGYVLKPFEERELATDIEMALYKHQAERKLRLAHDELERRVEERTRELKQAEQELRDMNQKLERRVTERTAELSAANASLNDSRRAALNMMEDAVAARKEAEETSAELQSEIGERTRAEEELLRLNKAFKALSDTSQAVIHAKDEPEYLGEVCRIVIEDCGYSMVWIGFAEEDAAKSVRPVAHAGFDEGYLESLHLSWADTERGRGPTGTTIRTGQVTVCRNLLTDPAFTPWRQEAVTRGYASSIVFPLRADDKVFGAINLYSTEPDPFTDGEVKLLAELADNLAYGIQVLRVRAAREKAEEALRESEGRVRRKLDSILSPEGDMGILDLADIIDIASLQALVDDFYELTRMPMGLLDISGKVLVGVGWQDICTKFHRLHPEACRNCYESDTALSAGVLKGEYKVYRCKNGMWDVATPVMVGDRHLGNLFMGQFLFEDEEPDYDLFRSQASRYGFDERSYLAALEAVPRLSRETLDTSMSFFMQLADLLSKLGFSNLKLARSLAERDGLTESLRKTSARLDLLAETAGRLLASDAPQEIVEDLCTKVMAFLGCDVFFNFLADEKAERLHLNACAGIPGEEAKRIEWLDYGVAVCGCAARDACRIVAEEIFTTPDPRTDLVRSYGIQAYACHPLLAQGKVIGTLSFGTRTRMRFEEDELALMNAVADHVAIAIERKQGEEALRQAKEMADSATRAKSRFLANMSHELRTPMTGVLGMLEVTLGGNLNPQQRECLAIAHTSGRSLLRIINDILDLAKIEAGAISMRVEPFSLAGCLASATDILTPEARRKGIDLTYRLAAGLPETIFGDQVRLRQILVNLVGNAVKFTEKGSVAVQVASGKRIDGTSLLVFSIIDTGIGIPEDKKHLLFRSFSQVDDSITRTYGGTGLGLAISSELAQRMGGEIHCASMEGKGSTFTLTIPLKGAVSAAGANPVVEPSVPTSSKESARPRLLIAEDDATNRQVLRLMLEQHGFDADFAVNGIEAVEKWQRGGCDLILMDVQMPRMDGFTATRAIREAEKDLNRRALIVAMTAHALKEDEDRCREAGMDAYISKPIDFQRCVAVIRDLLSQRPGDAGGGVGSCSGDA